MKNLLQQQQSRWLIQQLLIRLQYSRWNIGGRRLISFRFNCHGSITGQIYHTCNCLAVVPFLHYVAANFSEVQFHNHAKCVPAKKKCFCNHFDTYSALIRLWRYMLVRFWKCCICNGLCSDPSAVGTLFAMCIANIHENRWDFVLCD